MPDDRIRADIVFSGSGTLFDALSGAGERLSRGYNFQRYAGTSGGSIVAACRAVGYSWDDIKRLEMEILSSGKLLDPSAMPWSSWGINRGDYIHDVLKSVLRGKLGDTKKPLACYVCDLWARDIYALSSWATPDIAVADAVRASIAIPLFFKGVTLDIPHKGKRFLVDGGVGADLAMDAFDDEPDRPTIGVRFMQLGCSDSTTESLKATDFFRPLTVIKKCTSYATALGDILIENGSRAHLSEKNFAREIRIEIKRQRGSNFFLTPEDVEERWKIGYVNASRALRYRNFN